MPKLTTKKFPCELHRKLYATGYKRRDVYAVSRPFNDGVEPLAVLACVSVNTAALVLYQDHTELVSDITYKPN